MMVCSTENRMCMIHHRPNCPGTAAVKEYLQGALELDLGEEIIFKSGKEQIGQCLFPQQQ